MNIIERLKQSFSKNPGAWVLGGLLVFSMYSHYRTGAQFTKVCETVSMLEEGYFDLESSQTFHTTGIDLDAIMVRASEHEKLMKSDTPEGRAYRWWRKHSEYVHNTCSNRLSEPEPADDY